MKRGKKGKLRGVVEFSKVSERSTTEKLGTILGADSIKGKTLELKAEILLEWYLDRMEMAKQAGDAGGFTICENCGGPCEFKDPDQKCHFCGTGFDEEEPPVDLDKVDRVVLATDLDHAVERVKRAISNGLHSSWQLGRELLGIFDNQLYKKRVGDDGRPVYRNWDEFAETELNLSGPRARSFMDVARDFTEEQVVNCGVEKLRTIRRLPENRWKEFIAKAPALSTRQLANEAAAIYRTPTTPHQPAPPPEESEPPKEAISGRAAALKKGTEAAKAARDAKKREREAQVAAGAAVTAAFQLGEYDLPLEPEGDNDFKASDTLVNGVVVTYTIFTAGKKPFMRVKYERGS